MRSQYVPVKPKDRLYQDIMHQIQARILRGDLAPGDRLPAERQLAEAFGVSRTAVREALRALAEKGLLDIHVGRGTFVTAPSPEHVAENIHLLLQADQSALEHLQEARELLEVPVAGLAARHRTDAHLEQLAEHLDAMRRMQDHPRPFINADTAFHAELARATGNTVLQTLIQPIVELLREARTFVHDRGATDQAIERHQEIYERVAAGDEDGARAAMQTHLADVRRMTEALKKTARS